MVRFLSLFFPLIFLLHTNAGAESALPNPFSTFFPKNEPNFYQSMKTSGFFGETGNDNILESTYISVPGDAVKGTYNNHLVAVVGRGGDGWTYYRTYFPKGLSLAYVKIEMWPEDSGVMDMVFVPDGEPRDEIVFDHTKFSYKGIGFPDGDNTETGAVFLDLVGSEHNWDFSVTPYSSVVRKSIGVSDGVRLINMQEKSGWVYFAVAENTFLDAPFSRTSIVINYAYIVGDKQVLEDHMGHLEYIAGYPKQAASRMRIYNYEFDGSGGIVKTERLYDISSFSVTNSTSHSSQATASSSAQSTDSVSSAASSVQSTQSSSKSGNTQSLEINDEGKIVWTENLLLRNNTSSESGGAATSSSQSVSSEQSSTGSYQMMKQDVCEQYYNGYWNNSSEICTIAMSECHNHSDYNSSYGNVNCQ